jgi:hypothetical protein
MVAIEASELDQVPPVTVELKEVLPDIHTACVPDKVPAVTGELTVTVRVLEALKQPPVPTTV